MTREKEDELLAALNDLRLERSRLVRRIVEARSKGERDDDAITELEKLSHQHIEMTNPETVPVVAY